MAVLGAGGGAGLSGPVLSPALPEDRALGESPLGASVSLALKWTE